MLPICALQVFLIAQNAPAWMKWSGGAVVLMSLIGFVRGYVRRLILDSNGATLRRLTGSIYLPWKIVRAIGVYLPGGGVGATQYFYITARETAPVAAWDIDESTIQIQNREGLLEAAEALYRIHVDAAMNA